MSAADIEGLPSYPTEEGSGRGITLLASPMSCTLPFVAFPVCFVEPPMNQYMYDIKYIYFWCRWCTSVYDCLCVWVGVYIHLLHSWLFHYMYLEQLLQLSNQLACANIFFLPGRDQNILPTKERQQRFAEYVPCQGREGIRYPTSRFPTFLRRWAWGIDQKKGLNPKISIATLALWMICFGVCCGWSWCFYQGLCKLCWECVGKPSNLCARGWWMLRWIAYNSC